MLRIAGLNGKGMHLARLSKMALAVTGPIPGIVTSRRLVASRRCHCMILTSSFSISFSALDN
jgi:hypothetical protein